MILTSLLSDQDGFGGEDTDCDTAWVLPDWMCALGCTLSPQHPNSNGAGCRASPPLNPHSRIRMNFTSYWI